MSRQYFADVITEPLGTVFATITATSETVLIPTIVTPIPAGSMRVGQVYELLVGGTCTTGASGTLTVTPRFGTAIGGTSLGASNAQTVVPSITTAPFLLRAYLVCTALGQAGANSSVRCHGNWNSGGAAATAASETAVWFGTVGAAVSVDASVAQALWIGVTFSVAPSVIPQWHVWRTWN
jgi:hypothetical protein